MNVVTAVFVDSTIARSKEDRDCIIRKQLSEKTEFMCQIEQLFDELDHNKSLSITLKELEDHMQDASIVAYFASLQLDFDQVRSLFTLLDVDRSGSVDRAEFIVGCCRLRGTASSLEMAVLRHEIKAVRDTLHQLAEALD